jgi:3-demethoxyubiquinol 3-hydroxylase
MDTLILKIDKLLRTAAGVNAAERTNPARSMVEDVLSDAEKRHSAGLMRINHVGEVCAQALYEAQGQFATSPAIASQLAQAAREEEDHLAWTAERLREIGGRVSLLNPLWYAGAYALGMVAAKAGDARSLGFVVETERQVEAHLADHMKQLPAADQKSRAIVRQMCADEAEHGAAAQALGAAELPTPVKFAMRAMAKVMTRTAYYI